MSVLVFHYLALANACFTGKALVFRYLALANICLNVSVSLPLFSTG